MHQTVIFGTERTEKSLSLHDYPANQGYPHYYLGVFSIPCTMQAVNVVCRRKLA